MSRRGTFAGAAACIVACVLVLGFVPTPYVLLTPGTAVNLDAAGAVVVEGAPARAAARILDPDLSVSSPSSQVPLLDALSAYWSGGQEAVEASAVYPAGSTNELVAKSRADELGTAQQNAVAAALQAAQRPITPVPVVTSVSPSGPSAGRLEVNDIVVQVDDVAVNNAAMATSLIASRKVGGTVTFQLIRDGQPLTVTTTTVSHRTDPNIGVVGAAFGLGYRYDTKVTFGSATANSDASAGLALGLAVYDRVSDAGLPDIGPIAAIGTLDAQGLVGDATAVRERVASAEKAGATTLFLPPGNCTDLAGIETGLRVVPVASITEAVLAVAALSDPVRRESVKGCS